MNMLTVNYPEKNIGPSAGTKWQSKSIYCLILEILNDQNKLLKVWNICKTGSFGRKWSVEFDNLSGVLEIGGNWRETNYIGGFSNQYPSNGLISVLSFFVIISGKRKGSHALFCSESSEIKIISDLFSPMKKNDMVWELDNMKTKFKHSCVYLMLF